MNRSKSPSWSADLAHAHAAAIVASSSDAIVSKDSDGIVTSWNAAAERIFGWSAEEMIGHSIRRIIPPERDAEEDSILARIRAGERVPNFETWRLHKSGRLVPVSVTVSPIRGADGTIVGASKIAHDITERLDVLDRLATSETEFRALADNIPQLAWMAGADGEPYWYNARWHDFTGPAADGQPLAEWRSVIHPDHVEQVAASFQAALAAGVPWENTYPLRGADGRYRWFLGRARPVPDAQGTVRMWVGTNTDVTEAREAAQRIELLMNELNHRAKNMLAKVQAMVRGVAKGLDPAFVESLENRIAALARNQDMLMRRGHVGALLSEVVAAQTAFICGEGGERCRTAGGEDLLLNAVAAEAIGLALHELSTNAVKHGALSGAGGTVAIGWTIANDRLVLTWRERGGPPPAPDVRPGFGTILIERHPRAALDAEVTVDFGPAGLEWRLAAPVDRLRAEAG